MADVEKVIKEAEDELKWLAPDDKHRRHMGIMMKLGWIYDVLELLKPLAESKRLDNLRERRAGRTRMHLGDCPVCHRVVQFAQKHCHNCVQLLDWTEVLEMPCEDEDSPEA